MNHLRAVAARYPDDPELRELIAELSASPEFTALWDAHEIAGEPTLCSRSSTRWSAW